MNNLKRFRQGKYNLCYQVNLPDNTVKITLIDEKSGRVYKFRVRGLKTDNEQEVDYDTGQPITK